MPRDIVIREILDEETKRRWDRRRWKSDGVNNIPQGFTLRKRGRDGSIYYREGDRVLELYFEISGDPAYDISVATGGLAHWILPETEPLPLSRQHELRTAMESWLVSQNTRAHFYDTPSP
jgi:hypothetical protein